MKKQFDSAKDENGKLNDELRLKEKELKKYIDELKIRSEKIRAVNMKMKEQQRKKGLTNSKLDVLESSKNQEEVTVGICALNLLYLL